MQLGFADVKECCADFAKTVVKIVADAMKVDPSTIEAKNASDCSDKRKYDIKITYPQDKVDDAKKAGDISGSALKRAVKKSVEKVGAKVEVSEVKSPSVKVLV